MPSRAPRRPERLSLALGTLTNPERSSAFYPVRGTRSPPSWGRRALRWPSRPTRCPLPSPRSGRWDASSSARQALGRSQPALLVTPVVSVGLGRHPSCCSYGTLWPNALATLLLPAAATGAAVAGVAEDDVLGRRHACVASQAVLRGSRWPIPTPPSPPPCMPWCWPPGGSSRWVGSAAPPGPRRAGPAARRWRRRRCGASRRPPLRVHARDDWPARQTLAQAAGEALLLAPQRLSPPRWRCSGSSGCWRRCAAQGCGGSRGAMPPRRAVRPRRGE